MRPAPEFQAALDAIGAPDNTQARLGLALNWLGGRGRNELARQLEERLGPGQSRPDLMLAVYDWLDECLFIDGQLDEQAAGVDAQREEDARRRCYRQLLGAYHPDRHPDLAERLTERLQAINIAYARFKRVPEDDDAGAIVVAPPAASKAAVKAAPRYEGIAPSHPDSSPLASWRQRWGRDRYLGHKLIVLMALLALFPLVSMYLDDSPPPSWPGEIAVTRTPGQDTPRLPDGLAVRLEQWPPVVETAPWSEDDELARELIRNAGTASAGSDTDTDTDADTLLELPEAPDWLAELRRPRTWFAGLGKLINRADREPPALESLLAGDSEPAVTVADPTIDPTIDTSRAESRPETSPARPVPAPTPEPSVAGEAAAMMALAAEPAPVEPPGPEPQPSESTVLAEVTVRPGASEDMTLAATVEAEAEAEIGTETKAGPLEPPGLGGGELQLGILASHDLGALLRGLQQSIEGGDLDQLLDLLARSPRDSRGRGRDWFEQHYATLFEQTSQRALSLQVLSARRDGQAWQVEARYEFTEICAETVEQRRHEGLVSYRFQPERGAMRLASMEFE